MKKKVTSIGVHNDQKVAYNFDIVLLPKYFVYHAKQKKIQKLFRDYVNYLQQYFYFSDKSDFLYMS